MESIEGKTAIVTGGGSGIGRATALAFARAGARVLVADVDQEEGNNTVSLINAAAGKSLFVAADVSQSDQVKSSRPHVETAVSTIDFT